jgi:hypothetical protein
MVSLSDICICQPRVGFLRKRVEKRHPIVRELPVDCIEKNRDEIEPGSWRCAASLACYEQGFKHCPFVTIFRDSMNDFHVVAHHTKSFSMCLNCIPWQGLHQGVVDNTMATRRHNGFAKIFPVVIKEMPFHRSRVSDVFPG